VLRPLRPRIYISTRALRPSKLGGPFNAKPNGRWESNHVHQIATLKKDWQVAAFRHLIRPFYLRRAAHSKWDGKNIIPKGIRAPVPFLEDPEDPKDRTGEHYRNTTTLLGGLHGTTMAADKNRANHARMFAWCSLWEEWYAIEHNPNLTATHKMAQQTALMKAGLAKRKPTPRIVKLVSLLKMIKAMGEKFNSCHSVSPIIPQTLQQLDVHGPYVVVQKPDLYRYR